MSHLGPTVDWIRCRRSPGREPQAPPLADSGPRLRAPPQTHSTAARSPSGERHPPTSRLACGAAPLALELLRSLSTSWKRRGKEESELGFWGTDWRAGFVAPWVTRCGRSEMDDSRRVGLDSAQVGGEKVSPGLCYFNIRAAGLVTRPHSFLGWTRIGLWASFDLVFLSVFSFPETGINMFN
jgi:hypothetical protein